MENYKLIQCYNCLEFCHTRNNCQNETKCSRCGGAHEYPYTDCNATPKCCNCEGQHVATARICPKYIEAFALNEQKAAEQLSIKYPHLFTSPSSSPQSQCSNNSNISYILRAARLASKDPSDFANQLYQATSQLLPLDPNKLCYDYDDVFVDETAHDEFQAISLPNDHPKESLSPKHGQLNKLIAPETLILAKEQQKQTPHLLCDQLKDQQTSTEPHFSPKDISTPNNYHTHLLREGPTETEVRDLVRQKIESNKTYWRELIEQNDNDRMEFYAKDVRKHCRKKLITNETDEKAKKHYRDILAILNHHNPYYI